MAVHKLRSLDEFNDFANHDYLQLKIPKNRPSKSNFSDISVRNTQNLVKILNNLDSSTFDNLLLKTIFDKKINFHNIPLKEQYNTCSKIINILNDINKAKTLIEKTCILTNLGCPLFLSYNIDDNPSNLVKRPYIIEISQPSLSLSKDYYFNQKNLRELNGLRKHRKELLSMIVSKYPLYFNFISNEIDNICEDVDTLEMNIAPFILSNVAMRDVEKRINIYKLQNIADKFPNIDLLHDCFLDEFDLQDTKSSHDIMYSSNLDQSLKNFSDVKYDKLNDEEKARADNGDYYWSYIDNLFKLYKEDKKTREQIDNYIKWKVINNFSSLISDDIRLLKFQFYGTFLNGQQTEKPVDERAISYLIDSFPELVGEIFCNKYFDENHRLLMKKLIGYLIDTYEYNFKNKCKWLTHENSLFEALEKLRILKLNDHQKIGYPEKSTYQQEYNILYQLLEDHGFDEDSLSYISLFDLEIIENIWENRLNMIKYKRKDKDLKSWEMCAADTNAYYHPLRNEIVFPAGILQEPFFIYLSDTQLHSYGIDITQDPFLSDILSDRLRLSKIDIYKPLKYISMASNFGSIGAIIGHEISHGFDDQGSKFDSQGKMRTWWTKEVFDEYNKITDKIIVQYDKYSIKINIDGDDNEFQVNGKLTIGENIADLFGLRIAIDAFKKYYIDNPSKKTLDESMMELLISYANTWRYLEVPENAKLRINEDVHAPAKFRIIGTLQNIEEFYSVFQLPINNEINKIFL